MNDPRPSRHFAKNLLAAATAISEASASFEDAFAILYLRCGERASDFPPKHDSPEVQRALRHAADLAHHTTDLLTTLVNWPDGGAAGSDNEALPEADPVGGNGDAAAP